MKIFSRIINSFSFYFGWVICMWLASRLQSTIGLFITTLVVVAQFIFSPSKLKDLFLVLALVLAGLIIENAYIYFGVLQYHSSDAILIGYSPLWVLSLYALFATTINQSLFWLNHQLILAAIFGAIGAVFTYIAGEKMEIITFLMGKNSILIVGVVWFFFCPLTYVLNRYLKFLDTPSI